MPPTHCGVPAVESADPTTGVRVVVCPACGLGVAVCDADRPTRHPAGSEEKILVLIARARLRLPLFHPRDSADRLCRRAEAGPRAEKDLPPGVSLRRGRRQCYEARATVGGVRHFLGLFRDLETAVRAVEMALAGDVTGAKRLGRG